MGSRAFHDSEGHEMGITRRGSVAWLLSFVGMLWLATPAAAQTATPPDAPRQTIPGLAGSDKRNPQLIASRLRLGLQHHRRMIDTLNGDLTQETIRDIDKQLFETYKLVRAAHDGTVLRISKQKGRLDKGTPDPILVKEERALRDARGKILAAKFQVRYAHPGQSSRIRKGIALLQASVTSIESALALMGQPSAH
jgi:hypothetical protein